MVAFKAKDSETVATLSCLEKFLKDWSIDSKKRTGLSKYVYQCNVDYDPILGEINKAMPTFHNNFMFKYGLT